MINKRDKSKIVSGKGHAEAPVPRVTAYASVRHNMAQQHFRAAGYFCRSVESLEKEHAGKKWGPHGTEIRWNFAACVMLCIASIEAFYNETIDNVHFDEEYRALIERQSLLDKINLFLKLDGKNRIKKGEKPLQSIRALIELRNAFVHFRPEWSDKPDRSKKLESLLPKLAQNPFCANGDPFFPMRCVSSAYAWWAIESTYLFLEKFSALIGQDLQFPQKDKWGLAE